MIAHSSAFFPLLNTATTTEYFLVDPNRLLDKGQAIQMAREIYYYDDAYHVTAERADHWELGQTHYSGWIVKVLH